jgi:multiple sugar transport system permease protein
MTLPVGLDVLRGYLDSGNLSIVMAAMAMAIAPVVLVFLLAQRYIVEGMTMTGIKK